MTAPDGQQYQRGPAPESASWAPSENAAPHQIATAARVVFHSEPYMDFGPAGSTPRMAQRQVATSVWAPFGPVDYIRWLQRWAPALPHPRQGRGSLAAFLIILGVVIGGFGLSRLGAYDYSPGPVWMGGIFLVIGIFTWFSWLKAGNPNAADAVSGAMSASLAYNSFRKGHPIIGALNAAGAAQSSYSIYQRTVQANYQAEQDMQFWAQVEAQPMEFQWQMADGFRWSLALEYARRLKGNIQPENAPVPSYEQVVARLNDAPEPW